MNSEAVNLMVLRELVRRMGPDKLVTYNDDFLTFFMGEGVTGMAVEASLRDLVTTGRLELMGVDLYRVTHDGEMTIPMAPDVRQEPKRRTMAEKVKDQHEREAARLRLLDAVYELTGGNRHAAVPMTDAYARADLSWPEGSLAYEYLAGEGLLLGKSGHTLAITHSGVKEREAAVAGQGEEPTDHFPAAVIIQTFHAPVGSVQTGGQGNVAHVTQTAGVPSEDLASLVDALRVRAREHGDVVAVAAADKVHEHASATPPNTKEMTVYLKALSAFASLAPHVNDVLNAISGIGA